jgi:hypothetical protein
MTGASSVTLPSVAPPRREAACRKIGQLIAEPCQPERAITFGQAPGVIFVNRNARGIERLPRPGWPLPRMLHGLVFPPVVIAENRMDAKRRLQPGEHGRPFGGWNVARHMMMPGHVIAQHDDDIGIERIGALDDRLDVLQRHPGIAGVKVGDDGYLEL